ncbi:hypothetical protein J6A31_06080 [bacterium]|nr:hypothetical protein [bacterium]
MNKHIVKTLYKTSSCALALCVVASTTTANASTSAPDTLYTNVVSEWSYYDAFPANDITVNSQVEQYTIETRGLPYTIEYSDIEDVLSVEIEKQIEIIDSIAEKQSTSIVMAKALELKDNSSKPIPVTKPSEHVNDISEIDHEVYNIIPGTEYKLLKADLSEVNTEWTESDGCLNAVRGVYYGPSGKETYYNLPMKGVIYLMRHLGYSEDEYEYWVRDDGVKMFGEYVMVAANLDIRPKGTIVETSRGLGMVCDTGDFAENNILQLDIAVDW